MATKSRTRILAAKRVATAGVATAAVAALVVGTAPPPLALAATPGLPTMERAPGAPDPASIPDLTFGLGPRAYDAFQSGGATLESALLNNVNLSGVLQRLGFDPETAINTALGNLLVQTLTGVAVPVGSVPVLGSILDGAGYNNAASLLELIGFNLADPLNLGGAATPGINIITAGPPFSLLKFLGVDLGWTPGFPNSVAGEINNTPYLDVSALAVLQKLLASYPVPPIKNSVANGLIQGLIGTVKLAPGGDINAVDVRVPVVLGFGLGAFAAGMAYPQVVEQLSKQPGGADYTGSSPLAGSLTILPMILLRNPGRANGGLFARFYPEAGLLGIDTVTPDTEVSSSVNPNATDGRLNIPVGTTGIVLGGANLIPIKVDGTVEYDPLSDVPAWPNPVSLANSAAALAFPTYILRGVTAESLTEVVNGQLKPQLAAATGNTTGPLALNLYLTVPVNGALPLLEPVRLPVDVINLFTGANLNNPVATAFEPALTSLVNLGYTDVKRTVVNGVPVYNRTLDQGNVITPFGTLPSGVNWGQVPADLFLELAAGVQQAIAQGFVSGSPVANPLAVLANLLGLNGLPGAATASPLSGMTALSGLTDNAVTAAATATVPAALAQSSTPTPGAAKAGVPGIAKADAPSAANALVDNAADSDIDSSADTTTGGGTTSDIEIVDDGSAQPGNSFNAATGIQAGVDASVKKTVDGLGNIVKGVQDSVQKTVNAVSGAGSGADKPADKPSDNAGAKSGDKSSD